MRVPHGETVKRAHSRKILVKAADKANALTPGPKLKGVALAVPCHIRCLPGSQFFSFTTPTIMNKGAKGFFAQS
jgi:hypothetical protein